MHARPTPVHRKRLIDPAACGVRLGVQLRAAAEQEAYGAGMCLSHWIKKIVQEAVSKSVHSHPQTSDYVGEYQYELKPDSASGELESAFAKEMEKMK